MLLMWQFIYPRERKSNRNNEAVLSLWVLTPWVSDDPSQGLLKTIGKDRFYIVIHNSSKIVDMK